MSSDAEKDLVQRLRSTNTSDVYDALVKIRKKYVRSQHKMKKLQKYSVIELIIPFLEHPKFCNISLSIIADGCLELSFVNEVIKCNGVNSLMRIMKSLVNDDIQNRACRALGNMAKFEIGFKAVHLMKPIAIIINFLSETNDVNCQQTAVRTLMILGKSSKTREIIAKENGIVNIAKLLHSSDVQVLICSTKALASLTQNRSISCARQLLGLEFLKVLVGLYSHADKSVRSHVLMSLKNLSSQEEIRSDLVKVGAVKLFTDILNSCESSEMGQLAALALCSCLDHIHMWSHNGLDREVGLKALLIVLGNKNSQNIHKHIITSMIPLSYEPKISDMLLNLDIIKILIKMLEIFIETHKCSVSNFSQNGFKNDEIEVSKDIQDDSYESAFKSSVFIDKSPDTSAPKIFFIQDPLLSSFSPVTSDYSGSCSPVQKLPASPEVNYEFDVSSPSSGVWSPGSLLEENRLHANCWSPVVSTDSGSFTLETDIIDNQESKDAMECFTSPIEAIIPDVKERPAFDENIEASIYRNFLSSHSYAFNKESPLLILKNESNSDKPNNLSSSKSSSSFNKESQSDLKNKNSEQPLIYRGEQVKRKKLKTENSNKDIIGCQSLNIKDNKNIYSNDIRDTTQKEVCPSNTNLTHSVNLKPHSPQKCNSIKCISDSNKKLFNIKQLNENEAQTIDYYVILFILQLSFHIEKKTNSQIADKTCFSVLIDYLCLIHNPSPKAETVLLNLIKNRYCFEKLVLNGFVTELEEKMASPTYSCIHRSSVKLIYYNLIKRGKREVESDYGIGTLSHILVTSEKNGQFHALCSMSKLVTDKTGLFRLLFQANGLSLLMDFLSDDNISIRKSAVTSLCELYQSLTKDQKIEKCCFEGTCSMKTSSKCFYKESFLNVTFSAIGGVKILANREKICENSEYFSALLKGHFLENSAELISLPHISAENLSIIFHFLHGCVSENCCPYIKRIPFSVLLELLSDCEQFLLLKIKTFIEDRLCHSLFPCTVPKIYRQSKIHNSPELTKRALDFALSMDTLQKDLLWNCFEELINLESNLDFFDDIKNLLKSLF